MEHTPRLPAGTTASIFPSPLECLRPENRHEGKASLPYHNKTLLTETMQTKKKKTGERKIKNQDTFQNESYSAAQEDGDEWQQLLLSSPDS